MKTLKLILLATGILLLSGKITAQQYGATPEDSIECRKNISIYQEFYKQGNYQDAYEPWFWVYKNCPQASINTFIRGGVIVKNLIAKTKEPVKKQEYVSLLLSMWDKRTEVGFGQVGVNLGRKAYDQMQYCPDSIQQTYEMFKKSIELGGASDYIIPFYYLESAIKLVKQGKLNKEIIVDIYDQASTMLEDILDKRPNDTLVAQTLVNIEIAFQPYASCEDLIGIYEKKFNDIKNDAVALTRLTKLLDKKECTSSPLFFKSVEALHALEPTPQTAYLMGKMSYEKKQYSKTVEYLSGDVINKMPKERDRINAYLLLANSYGEIGNGAAGRTAAYKALEINPNLGRAYIIIGNLYARSAASCGDNPEVGQKAAYWAAVDKYAKAKSVDPSVADLADQLIATYARHFPSGNDLFMYGFNVGESYRVGCWIQETTTIRSR